MFADVLKTFRKTIYNSPKQSSFQLIVLQDA
jgi:hypothetical protein